jgi:alpha-ketoglutarate-dependent taurine dioxygenase
MSAVLTAVSACEWSAGAVPPNSPFHLEAGDAYARWRERKLRNAPATIEDLLVEVDDPRELRPVERSALAARCGRANMAIYASPCTQEDREIPRRMARTFGLQRLDPNWLADDDAISSIQVRADGPRSDHIPYTNHPIHWHTDGYYNPPQRRIRAMVLHCVGAAAVGGENVLMDHEMAYLLLRDENPEFVRALSAPDAMTIPARWEDGRLARPEQSGPVFLVEDGGRRLLMRYTARTRSIAWRDDPVTRAAVACLEAILAGAPGAARRAIFTARLRPGMGLLCANVLHARTGFTDDPARPRLLYRARYYDSLGT